MTRSGQYAATSSEDTTSVGTAREGVPLRAQVADSWRRSLEAGVEADAVHAAITLSDEALREQRAAHPLAAVFPLLDDVLGQAARDCDAVMAVSDASAQLLWVCGNPTALRRAERIGFVEGSNWDERLAGTNAPGVAVTLDRSVQVIGQEHFRRSVQQWSCAASPIHDPATGALLGVLDVTGGPQVAVPQTLAMVRAAARMAETELAHRLLTSSSASESPAAHLRAGRLRVHLEALGRSEALMTFDLDGRRQHLRLSPRHSEIVVLLASAPRGLSGDELGVLLYPDDFAPSTLRAEVNRLRALLGDEVLASRPYRLVAEVGTDWSEVTGRAEAGDLAGALARYSGVLLPRSVAPGVERLRVALADGLREQLVGSGRADLMSAWTRSAWGRDDYQVWQALRTALGVGSPLLPLVEGQLARLDVELR